MTPQLPYAVLKQVFARFAEIEPEPKGELEHVNAFTLLVAVALSAQATDVGVNKATRKLFQIADTPQKMLDPRGRGIDRAYQDHRPVPQQGEERHQAFPPSDREFRRRGAKLPRCPHHPSGGRPQDRERGPVDVVSPPRASRRHPYLPRRQPHGHLPGPRRNCKSNAPSKTMCRSSTSTTPTTGLSCMAGISASRANPDAASARSGTGAYTRKKPHEILPGRRHRQRHRRCVLLG